MGYLPTNTPNPVLVNQYNGYTVPCVEVTQPSDIPIPITTSAAALMGTREYNYAAGTRTAVATAASANIAIGTLNAAREVMINASVRCFVKFGASNMTAPAVADANLLPVEPGALFHTRIPAGATHYSVIRDTTDGFIRVISVL